MPKAVLDFSAGAAFSSAKRFSVNFSHTIQAGCIKSQAKKRRNAKRGIKPYMAK